jgi:CO/xanthine dehydrogenase Mo-binding subunit
MPLSEFPDHPMLSVTEMPAASVDLGQRPGGVGETATLPTATTDAIPVYACTGKPIHHIPATA